MKKISSFFYRISSGWITLLGLVLFLAFCIFIFPTYNAQVDVFSHGLGEPDTNLLYNSDTLLHFAEAYGDEGRSAFLKVRWTFDLAFPLIYTFFLATTISFSLKKGAMEASFLRGLNLLPLLAMVFDLAENTATSAVMAVYPDIAWGQFLAPIFTPIKWFFVTFSMLSMGTGLLIWLYRRIFSKRKASASLL